MSAQNDLGWVDEDEYELSGLEGMNIFLSAGTHEKPYCDGTKGAAKWFRKHGANVSLSIV